MPGRRAALAIVLAGAAAFGGGAAIAATHGGAHTLQPPRVKQMKHPAVTNVHLPCHNRGTASKSV